MGLRYGLEFPVVVLPAPADLFNPILPAVEMDHLMEHGVQRFLDGVIQHLGGNVQFIGPAVLSLPDLGRGAVSIGSRLALHRDNGDRQLPAKEICVEAVVDVLQLTDGPAHFCGLFHCVALHNTEDVVAKLARELVSTPPHASLSAVKTWPQGQLRAKKCPRPFTEPGIFFCGLARR